jgi:hypothetical protein
VYLCESDTADALESMRQAIRTFLARNGVDPIKYNETLTTAWVHAVRYFMEKCGKTHSFEQFLESDARLLDTDIMLTHYCKDTLFSEKARATFVSPDIEPIPQY